MMMKVPLIQWDIVSLIVQYNRAIVEKELWTSRLSECILTAEIEI